MLSRSDRCKTFLKLSKYLGFNFKDCYVYFIVMFFVIPWNFQTKKLLPTFIIIIGIVRVLEIIMAYKCNISWVEIPSVLTQYYIILFLDLNTKRFLLYNFIRTL